MNNEPDFTKAVDGLLPAIIQDDHTGKVLMQGYMNKESLQRTLDEKVVWFYSRSKQRLWKKGETSGNELQVCSVRLDCDLDSILIKVIPLGPVCHTGADTCFNEINTVSYDWIKQIVGNFNGSFTHRIICRRLDSRYWDHNYLPA